MLTYLALLYNINRMLKEIDADIAYITATINTQKDIENLIFMRSDLIKSRSVLMDNKNSFINYFRNKILIRMDDVILKLSGIIFEKEELLCQPL
jgi:hypothetical protein